MRLKIRTVAAAATAVGLVAAVSGALLVWMARGEGKWLVVVPVLMFAAVFVASRFFFNRFVAFRIKPIYQILLSKSVRTHELSQKADPVGHIEDELNRWAEKNAREIARLKENERYRKEFLGNVSHEIKTPIFTLQGYIVTLLDGAIEDKAVNRKYLERSEKNIDRLIHIVDDLEEISKLEAGAPVLEKECFDVVALVREIADSLEMDAARRRIGFVDMFDRVLVEVKDDGIGIAEENIPRVFERFFRVDKSRSREQGGTGLGLAIVKHILEAHGERITLRSKLGEGSAFSFTLSKK
ncbi:sensor histidine kinase [Alistipes ihumii]|uniref:sensor histidine kinase n=1 Tax=Alistipes ihumii TaxID=1470347 RepID=UPI002658DF6D|nr:ATP-binding protein [Alistipes ihumii]